MIQSNRFRIGCLATAVILLLFASSAQAQTPLPCVTTTTPADYVPGRSVLTFTSPDHATKTAAGADVIADYVGDVRVQGQPAIVTNFTIPKASLTPQGAIANCFGTALPQMTGLLPTNLYTVTVTARGPGGTAVAAAASNPFSVVGAPRGAANTVVVP